ncbi:MAG: hypothetical protein ACE5DX_04660 [Candidatus Dojkabacteria bacterium]
MSEDKLTKKEKQLIRALRDESPNARIDPEFRDGLKQDLLSELADQKKHSVSFITRYRLLAALAVAAVFILPLMFVLSTPENITQVVKESAVHENTVTVVDEEGPDGVKTDFGSAVNSRDTALVSSLIADEVDLVISGTSCCGMLQKIEAVDELLFQISEAGIFDFTYTTNSQIGASENGMTLDYEVGSEGLVTKITISEFEGQDIDNETVARSFMERVNALDYEGIEELLAGTVDIDLGDGECCGEVERENVVDQLKQALIDTIPYKFEEILQDGAGISGVNDNEVTLTFTLDDELKVNSITL